MLNESWKSLEKHFEEGIALGIGEVKAFWHSWLSMQLGNSMQDEEVELWENRNLGENNKKKSKQNKKKEWEVYSTFLLKPYGSAAGW